MRVPLLKIYKIPEKIPTRSFWTLPVTDIFNIYFIFFHIVNFYVYHYEDTPTGYVQNTDSNPSELWLLIQRYYRWKINCLTLPQVTLSSQIHFNECMLSVKYLKIWNFY